MKPDLGRTRISLSLALALSSSVVLFGAAGALMALPAVATGSGFLSAYIARHELVEDGFGVEGAAFDVGSAAVEGTTDATERLEDP